MNDGPTLIVIEEWACDECRFNGKHKCMNENAPDDGWFLDADRRTDYRPTPHWCPRKEVKNAKPNPT